MAATRLTQEVRNGIIKFLKNRVEETTDFSERDKFREEIKNEIIKFLKEKFPVRDMNVLKKYGKTSTDGCVRFMHNEAWRYDTKTFRFTEEESEKGIIPLFPYSNCQTYLSKNLYDKIEKLEGMTTDLNEAANKRLNDFAAVIRNAKTFEQVVEIMPIVATIRDTLYTTYNVPSIVSPELLKSISEDAALVETK